MRVIITESQYEFIRRYNTLKELVENGIDVISQNDEICGYTLSEFLAEVSWQVSDHMDDLNMDNETLGTIEKIHRWVRKNFGEHITKEFDKLIQLNCVNSFDDAYEDD